MSDIAHDPYLTLSLDGIRAIEASAGTGKTYTLATLVLRLVIERRLQVGEILAVTFTEAATQELRSRIRRRLLLAIALLDAAPADDALPEQVLARAVIDAHLALGDETVAALRRRLRAAANGIDLSAVFTIHGFCARVLREHALEAGQGFDAPELLASDANLREAIAADLWRAHGAHDDSADDLLALWPQGPDALAADLSPLMREAALRPSLAELPDDPAPRLRVAGDALAATLRAHGDDLRACLLAAVEAKVLHGGSYRADWIGALFDALKTWCDAGDTGAPFAHPKLANLGRDTLLQRTSKAGAGRTPDSPVCAFVPPYLDALAAVAQWQDVRRVRLLHGLRDDARARLAAHKRQQRVQTYDDLIDRVADALDGPHADALVARLRQQYAVALVDEFQDTDPRQWRIFDRVFGAAGGAPALFVIGDPKQAIYGFRGGDVDTYLAARAIAERAPPLSQNFRSRPGVLRAIAALYAQAGADGAAPFVDPRIDFLEVVPGGMRSDADFLRDGAPAPALTLWRAPDPSPDTAGKVKPYSAGRSRELATQACVAAIHGVLIDARAGRAVINGAPVAPGDIAVLVRSHAEATRVRQALAEVGIPAVAAGRQNLFATGEARELHTLLLALLHGADDGRLRAALSTVLIGEDAQRIAALGDPLENGDGDALREWQLAALAWRERLQRGGPLALVAGLCATHAPRLLGLYDGERRLSNYLQLGEALQEAQARALGLHGLVDWLGRSIAGPDLADDTRLLRLESDAHRVQIVTLHKSKGLEYPLVFLPFAGIGRAARGAGQHVAVHDDEAGERVLHWKLLVDTSGWDGAKAQWADAQRAEDARLLYVGLTRAEHALWIATGAFFAHDKAPLSAMVGNVAALETELVGALALEHDLPVAPLPWLAPEREQAPPPARIARNTLSHDWWVYSFTQLANADAGMDASAAATQPVTGGRDEPMPSDAGEGSASDAADADASAFDPRFGGTRFGVALHDALEHLQFPAWRAWTPGQDAPDGEADVIVAALGRVGYPAADIADGAAVLVPMIGHTLTVGLPVLRSFDGPRMGGTEHARESVRLADLPASDRRAEIEFQFSLAPTSVDALLALLHAHGVLRERHGFGLRRRLEGLMTGLIDLTYVHDGRWYVLDYKSNRLARYAAADLDAAMAHSEYDLQALIYTVALHRWLRFRLGSGYDYARDFGGARYLFCRGLDATRPDSPGIQAWRFAPELVHALDALFAGNALPLPQAAVAALPLAGEGRGQGSHAVDVP